MDRDQSHRPVDLTRSVEDIRGKQHGGGKQKDLCYVGDRLIPGAQERVILTALPGANEHPAMARNDLEA